MERNIQMVNKKRKLIIILCFLTVAIITSVWFYNSKKPTFNNTLDYSIQDNWAIKEISNDKSADVFFICPTVDMGKDGNLNMSMDNEKIKSNFVGAINMEKDIYDIDANFYAPYYRQITFPAYSMDNEESKAALDLAYYDVKAAFEEFIKECDRGRPIIIAGFSQGSQIMVRLMEDCFDDENIQKRLVAAYAIGWRITDDDLNKYEHLKMAQSSNDVGVIVSFNSEAEGVEESMLVPKGVYTHAINPLSWKTDGEHVDASYNKGACFTNYDGGIDNEIPNFCGAYLNQERGTLVVTGISPEDYPGRIFEDGIYHLYDYQFFYRNLQDNVAERIEAWKKINQ